MKGRERDREKVDKRRYRGKRRQKTRKKNLRQGRREEGRGVKKGTL